MHNDIMTIVIVILYLEIIKFEQALMTSNREQSFQRTCLHILSCMQLYTVLVFLPAVFSRIYRQSV